MWRAYRVVTSASKGKQWVPWILHTTHVSRVSSSSTTFKKLCLQMPGQDPMVDWYPVIECPARMLAIQYHNAWESELFAFLDTEIRKEVVVPGPDVEHTRNLFRELSKEVASSLVEQFGRFSRFAVMGVPWYNCNAFDGKPWRLSAFIKDKKNQHAPVLFSYILAAFWDMGELLGVSKDVALQATSYNQVRIGLSKEAMDVFRPAMLKLHESVGLVVVDEGTEEWLTDQDNDSASTASTVPDD